jgi:polyisoprenoid-binding protein YceI
MTTTETTALPLKPGRWVLDTAHSGASFAIRHLGVAKVRGRFNTLDATLDVGETLEDSSLVAIIDATTVDTGNADRDAHTRSAEMLDVEAHPEWRFESTRITGDGETFEVEGEAVIAGNKTPFSFEVEFHGVAEFPATGNRHAGFSSSGQLSRKEIGLTFEGLGPADKLLGDKVTFELDAEFLEPRDEG